MGIGSVISFFMMSPKSLAVFSDRRNVSAVNDVFASSNRRGPVGSQERNQLCDFFGAVGATERNPAKRIHEILTRGSRISPRLRRQPLDQSFGCLSFGESGRN